jgi:hypothetical protein
MSRLPPPRLADLITRRRWLLRLGETVALAGVGGIVPKAVAKPLTMATTPRPTTLPPGLYLPLRIIWRMLCRPQHILI